MSRQAASSALAMGALIFGLVNAATAQETCVPVAGTIVNNFAAPDGSVTLGVVSLKYGPQKGLPARNLKCALSGQATDGPEEINFIHSISCDDAISMPAGDGSGAVPVHSSIVLFTTGSTANPQTPTQLFTFTERSTPIPDTARGLFFGATPSSFIEVTGAVYKSPVDGVPGSIDMKFSGQICKAG